MAYNFGAKPMAYMPTWQNTPGPMGNISVVDSVPQEMLFLVDKYWYQFPPMNPLWHVSEVFNNRKVNDDFNFSVNSQFSVLPSSYLALSHCWEISASCTSS